MVDLSHNFPVGAPPSSSQSTTKFLHDRPHSSPSSRFPSSQVELVEALHAGGASYREIADGAGVKFHMSSATTVRTITVHGPRGLRIEGLSLDGIAALLLRLSS